MPKEEPENDLCRCCHAEGAFKNLYAAHTWLDVEDLVYSKLLQECFDIEMAPVTQPLQNMLCSICDTCIERLQDAVTFKRQVLKCEKRFRDVYGSCVGEEATFDVKVKQEINIEPKDGANTSAVAEAFRSMDDDDDDDGFNDRDDDFFKSSTDVKVKKEVADSDSEDDMFLNEVGKRKASAAPKAPKKSKMAKADKADIADKADNADNADDDDNEELEVIEGVSLIRVKTIPLQRGKDYIVQGDVHQCLKCAYKTDDTIICSRRALGDHFRSAHQPKYKCPHCFDRFPRLAALRKHKLEIHNVDNRIKCNACDLVLYKKHLYQQHRDGFHMLGPKYTCEVCGFETYHKESFTKHKSAHTAKKDQQCQYCQKTFKRRYTMLRHERIHTGDKRKVCTECGQKFVQRASLKYHMVKHHPGVDF